MVMGGEIENHFFTNARWAISPIVSPCLVGIGKVFYDDFILIDGIGPSMITPPIGLGLSRIKNSTPPSPPNSNKDVT